MSTKSETKPQQAVATQAAPPRKEAWENFQTELEKRATEIGSQLPSNVSRDRFLNASIAAVKQTPSILTATPRSLFAALTKAAQDGLLPDGREGVITVFNQKVPNTSPQQYENIAQWNPMFYGIRKRARELDGIIIDAQVVFAGDDFEYELGDSPFIKHKPKPRSEKSDASAGLAVYAIFRHPTEGILHREVMWRPDVFDVMNQSRAKTSLMWTTFWTEGWKKTVGRRAAKSVPVSPALERLITRDDENFEFAAPKAIAHHQMAEIAPPDVPDVPGDEDATEPGEATGGEDDGPLPVFNVDAYLARLGEELSACTTGDEVEDIFDRLDVQVTLGGMEDDEPLKAAFALKLEHMTRVKAEAFPGDLPIETQQAVKLANTP